MNGHPAMGASNRIRTLRRRNRLAKINTGRTEGRNYNEALPRKRGCRASYRKATDANPKVTSTGRKPSSTSSCPQTEKTSSCPQTEKATDTNPKAHPLVGNPPPLSPVQTTPQRSSNE